MKQKQRSHLFQFNFALALIIYIFYTHTDGISVVENLQVYLHPLFIAPQLVTAALKNQDVYGFPNEMGTFLMFFFQVYALAFFIRLTYVKTFKIKKKPYKYWEK
jgi:hypothetical protein